MKRKVPNKFFSWWAGLFAAALAIRLIHLWLVRADPLVLFPIVDAEAYDLWARRLAGGEWIGKEIFYQDPLYPYLLGIVYAAVGRSVAAIQALQAAADAAAVVGIGLIAKRVFDVSTGRIAGVAAAIAAVPIFYVPFLEKTAATYALIVLMLWTLLEAGSRRDGRWVFAAGAATAAAVLVRANLYLFVPAAALWMAWVSPRRKRRAAALVFLAGLGALLFPVALRNKIVGGEWVLSSAHGGWNLYKHNLPDGSGWLHDPHGVRGVPRYEAQDVRRLTEKRLGRPVGAAEASRYWTRQAVRNALENPGATLVLGGRKLKLLANAFELPDSYDFYYFRRQSPLLWLPVGYWLVFPLGVGAMALLLWRRRPKPDEILLLAFAGIYTATLLMTAVSSRYRMPLWPVLIVFGARGAFALWESMRRRKYKPVLPLLAVALPLAAAAHVRVVRQKDPDGPRFLAANALLDNGEPARALAIYDRLLLRHAKRTELHRNRATALARLNRIDEALNAARQSLAGSPADPGAYAMLAKLYAKKKDAERVVIFSAAARALSGGFEDGVKSLIRRSKSGSLPARIEALDLLAFISYRNRQPALAVSAWKSSLKLKPGQPGVLLNLFLALEKKNPKQASGYLRRYLETPQSPPAGSARREDLERRLSSL